MNRYLIIGGASLLILGFLYTLKNFSGFAEDLIGNGPPGENGGNDGFSSNGDGFFKLHIWSMGAIFIGGVLSTIGIIRALIEKFGDGKVIDNALQTLGGEKNYTTIHQETVHGHKFGNVLKSSISIESQSSSEKGSQSRSTESIPLKEKLLQLVRTNKIEECLQLLVEQFTLSHNSKALGDGILLARRYEENKAINNKRTEHTEEIRVERERIINAILALIEQEVSG